MLIYELDYFNLYFIIYKWQEKMFKTKDHLTKLPKISNARTMSNLQKG